MGTLFDLNFGRWEIILLSLAPAIINLIIFFYISLSLPPGRTKSSFAIFVFLIALWQIGDGFTKMSQTETVALEWYRISGIFISFIISYGILFILSLSKVSEKISDNFKFSVLFLPAIICTFFIVARLDSYSAIRSHYWYWIINPMPTFITSVIYAWLALGGLSMIVLLFVFLIREKENLIKRKQFLLIAGGFGVPFFGGLILEIICPLFFEKNTVPITNSLITVFSLASLIAIKKYRLFEYSPKHQFDKIMESVNEGIVIVDNQDQIMYANKRFYQLLGYDAKELNNKNAVQILFDSKDDRERISEINDERKMKISSHYEIQVKRKSGEKIWARISGTPYLDRQENIIGSIAIFTDINLLKQTEIKLLQSVNSLLKVTGDLKEAQAIAHMGKWELDFATGKSVWCDEACRIYGIPTEEGSNQSFKSWLSFIHPGDLEIVMKEIEHSNKNLRNLSMHHRILLNDGTVKYIHSVSRFKYNSEGNPVGVYGVCHDITELKKTEEKLKTANKELKIFVYKSSHDLRAPLASVLGLINVARLNVADKEVLKYLGYINEQCLKLDNILARLVEVMSLRNKSFQVEIVDVKELLMEILDSLKNIDGFEKVRFNINNQLAVPIQTNRDFMYCVILNLIENAIKYRRRNYPDSEVNITLLNEEDKIIIKITDNGLGIKEAAQDKVFDMFYRASNETRGSGLGLYLVKIIVEKLGGDIYLESKENLGTTFKVALPYAS